MRSYRSTTAAAEHKVATRFIANEFGHAKSHATQTHYRIARCAQVVDCGRP